MTMELKKGDKVRIKPNLTVGIYGTNSVVNEMLKYAGKIATIENVYEPKKYRPDKQTYGKEYIIDLDCNYYSWTKEMFTVETTDKELFSVIEDMIGVTEKELELDYEANYSKKPTRKELINYIRNKFEKFL